MKAIILFFFLFFLYSCSKVIPARFWQNFEKEKIGTQFSDQGPFGGTAGIVWQSSTTKFGEKKILEFAKNNKWILTQTINAKNGVIDKVQNNYTFDLIIDEKLVDADFKNSKIYIFKSGMIAVKPGNSSETEENGFLLLNDERNKLKMFNRWGE
ncbi:hypothetical protein [Chryseobacterium sp.]|uniref:hypothetical protein n=1 Tax=Chryseobacterium sp. TaxID=1871047 RepID=UPI0011CB2739|nr:hypothetical protein [Chryseobacterium sp.]TXF75962.1 hypothetical protein FUA25_08650 [Chryseobacterium sp.]